MTIPADTTLPWHTHPMPNAADILSGQITVEERATGRKRVIRAGQAFNESVDYVHRGHTGPESTVCHSDLRRRRRAVAVDTGRSPEHGH
ncbi:hypothetical protein [Azotobacter beijerinckii]|nr:hypothetical protein [Azotobacter beijerinckii]